MPTLPALHERLRVLTVPGEGAVLLSEAGERVLHGALYAQLLPLLDGSRDAIAIAERLAADHPAAEVFYAIAQLDAAGHLGGADATVARTIAPAIATREVAFAGERVLLVLADSYLRPELAGINAEAMRSGRPWLLARPGRDVSWVGPLLRPGATACWHCLEQRLRRNRPFEYHLVRRDSAGSVRGDPEALLVLAQTFGSRLTGNLVVVDREGGSRAEPVERRPQCPVCGDAALYARQADAPWTPASRPRRFAEDGGYRAVTPRETVAAHARLVGTLTGVVQDLAAIGDLADPAALRVSVAHYGVEPGIGTASLLERGPRPASGKGMTEPQAQASALGEAIERYACVFQGDEPRLTASLEALGDDAIHPNRCMQYSEAQYAEREAWNRRATRWQWVPRPLAPAEPVEWSPVRSLITGARKWLPTMFLYAGYPAARSDLVCVFDPSGNASGTTREEAALQGLLELVERDSLAIWWYNRVPRPAVDIAAAGIPWCDALVEAYRARGRELWVLDLTTDLGVPSCAAVSRHHGAGPERILLGFGAHLDPRLALTRALTEMNQILAHVAAAEREGRALEPTMARWLEQARIADDPWLAPAGIAPRAPAAAAGPPDLADDLRECVRRLAERGLVTYVLDQTRPDIRVPVMKVVVPGLRHFRARFAPGRLYDVPPALHWLERPRTESELNPIAFFL